mgnify:CR=1 FL=1
MSHFSLLVGKRSNFGHYLQLPIAITNATADTTGACGKWRVWKISELEKNN